MKKAAMRISGRIYLGCIIGIIGLVICISYGEVQTGQVATKPTIPCPTNLKVEYAERPLGIDELNPRFAWLPLLDNQGIQQACQIWVATSLIGLLNGENIVWDSGKITSSDSREIEYAGPALESRTRYFWKVRVWDSQGRVSDWSSPSWWEMGLLDPDDWQAEWIGGRQDLDHDWSDLRITFDFTLNGTALNFLFRARPIGKTYGETYNWEITSIGGRPTLREQVRHYPGGSSSRTTLTTLKEVTIPNITVDDLVGKRHQIVIDANGSKIMTWIDGILIDTVIDDSQKSGTIGVKAQQAEAALIHQVSVDIAGNTVFLTDFANNTNPFTAGHPTIDGLQVSGIADGKDAVLPISIPAPLLRKVFDINGKVESARLYVTAGGWPKITLNGQKVGDTALENGFTAYDKRVLYSTYDVTELVQEGSNVIGIELGRGWYGVTVPNEWYWHMASWHGNPSLRAQLEITFTNGERQIVTTDGIWRTMDGPTTDDSIYGGEHYDARLEPTGWRNIDYNDDSWVPATVVAGPAGKLVAAELEPIKVIDTISPVAITEPRHGTYVFDFGRIFAGWVQLNVSGPAGQTVSMIHAEKLSTEGTVQVASRLIDAQLQTDYYTLAGGGSEQWEPSFCYKGFRYVQVEGFPGTPTRAALVGKIAHSSVELVGTFTCSNDLLNKIQQAARNTILNNLHGFQTDTPTYEKNGWTGDAQASSLAAAINFDMARVWTKWMADFQDAQSAKGEIPEIVPTTSYYGYENTPGWNMTWGPVPSWDAATFILPWDMYRNYGDTRILTEMYDTQKKLVEYTGAYINAATNYTYKNPNNLFLGEYSGRGPVGPVDATAVAYHYLMVEMLAKIADILGKTTDAATYLVLADNIRDAYNARYWDATQEYYRTVGANGTVQPYAQTQNVLPLAFGLVPEGHETAVVNRLNADIVARDYHLTAGIYGIRYLMTILSDYGYTNTAFRVAAQTTEPSWGWWIANGLSTMLEGWSLNSRSYDHHYFGSISSWFYQSLAGIRPGEAGYKTLIIKPCVPAGLEQVCGSINTVRGYVESSWKQASNGKFELHVTVPSNTPTEVWIPSADGDVSVEPAGPEFNRSEDGRAVYSAGSGTYVFRSKLLQ
ncbi:MAG: family 78 glycoside hydrolase catalytic domain [Fidelibacterota bacterium]|nr:MAG: family 78 glycoside hydrolase catalytic domain [Candidatus Neomarinimicrobiota bacterium]